VFAFVACGWSVCCCVRAGVLGEGLVWGMVGGRVGGGEGVG